MTFHKYDREFNKLSADTFGIQGQDNYPFIYRSLDYHDGNFIIGGMLDGLHTNIDFFTTKKKFYLARYSEQMEQIWYREYGGDRAYIMLGLRALHDGSYCAFGYVTDTITQIRYPYLMRVNEHGDIVSTTEIPPYDVDITIANPGSEYMYIQNNTTYTPSIMLYSTDGRRILQHTVDSGANTVGTAHLPAGVYVYQILEGNRLLKSGKWMKVD